MAARPESARDREFGDYVASRAGWLQRTAFLLCGSRPQAEDLVQITLVKLYVAWPRARRADSVDAYARKVLTRVCIDEARRPGRRESASAVVADRPDPTSATDRVADRLDLDRALARLPRRQRAAVVLRFWQDQSVYETAEAMGCSESSVKSHTSRGVAALRAALAQPVDSLNGEAR